MRTVKQIKGYTFDEQIYNLYTDGSLRQQNCDDPLLGLGADLRDSQGKKVLFYSQDIRASALPSFFHKNHFEELALYHALLICAERGIRNIAVKSDAEGMVSRINHLMISGDASGIDKIIMDVMKDFKTITCSYVPRENNQEADFYSRSVARLANKDFLNMHLSGKTMKDLTEQLVQEVKEDFARKHLLNRPTTVGLLPSHEYCESMIYLKDNMSSSRYEVTVDKRKIDAPYRKDNKELVLLFLTQYFATGKSSIRFDKSHQVFRYQHEVWGSFSKLENKHPDWKEQTFYMTQEIKEDMKKNQSFDFSRCIFGKHLRQLTQVAFNPKACYYIRQKCYTPRIKP